MAAAGVEEHQVLPAAEAPVEMAVSDVAIAASQIVSRLEQAAAAEEEEEEAAASAPPAPQQAVLLGEAGWAGEDVLRALERLLGQEALPAQLQLDDVARLVLAAHSVAALCHHQRGARARRVAERTATDASRWLLQVFGVRDCDAALFHEDHLEGAALVARLRPFDVATATIYGAPTTGRLQRLARLLGLPASAVRPVHRMEAGLLQRQLAEDVAAGRRPLLVLAEAGAGVCGATDDLDRCRELCSEHGARLHVSGRALAALALCPAQLQANATNSGGQKRLKEAPDSLTLDLADWLGVPGLPYATLYKTKGDSANLSSTLCLDRTPRPIALPLWVGLQSLGRVGVRSRIEAAFSAVARLYVALEKFPRLRILSPRPAYSSVELSRSIPVDLDPCAAATCVVFQFASTAAAEEEEHSNESSSSSPAYCDKLNSWLGQILQMDAPQVPLELCEVEGFGCAVRFSPLEHAAEHEGGGGRRVGGGCLDDDDDVEQFCCCLVHQLDILEATERHKRSFGPIVAATPGLRYVELPDWAGLGGVRYEPEHSHLYSPADLDRLNVSLVDVLRSTDSAFSLGESAEGGGACVRFGMLTAHCDLEELLALVVRVGRSVEENCRALDSMGEIVKKGIEAATLDLQKENAERIWQEGILRHVPVVGSIVNWWSPRAKETGVRGRSLDLTQGVVESTENIYKYHMQLTPGANANAHANTAAAATAAAATTTAAASSNASSSSASSSTRSPPAPQVQTSVTPNNINNHINNYTTPAKD